MQDEELEGSDKQKKPKKPKKRRKAGRVVFKVFDQNQPMLLPPSLDDLVPENHPVRVVNEVIERIDTSAIERNYKGGGTSSYHPRLLLKVLVYAYLRNIYSSRKMEQALQESVHFMWLAGNARPDHNTLADFRSKRLKGHLEAIFTQVVLLLVEEGAVTLREAILDGTKIEANANRYTFVWAKTVARSKERIREQLREVWKYVERASAEEEQMPNEPDFEAVDPEAVKRTVDAIDDALVAAEPEKKVRERIRRLKKELPAKAAKAEEQERKLAGRNSYSKTDTDATFMRSKDDHLGTGQLKPSYNLQITTEDHYVTSYSATQSAGDTTALPDQIEKFTEAYGAAPDSVTADAGYGSEENYSYLEDRGIKAFVKFPGFDARKPKRKFAADNFAYDEKTDTYRCPEGHSMTYSEDIVKVTKNGWKQQVKVYRTTACAGCPMLAECSKSEHGRSIERNEELLRHRQKAREMLESDEGIERRHQRYEVEAVIGNIKENKGFRRFLLRGLEKIMVEIGLVAIAQNLNRFAMV
jgi:transposase